MDKTWTKYDYVCNDRDALMEITTLIKLKSWRGWCSCGSPNIINVGTSPAIANSVREVTSKEVVKINSNPYN
jgi:hypothetical protein